MGAVDGIGVHGRHPVHLLESSDDAQGYHQEPIQHSISEYTHADRGRQGRAKIHQVDRVYLRHVQTQVLVLGGAYVLLTCMLHSLFALKIILMWS